MKVPVRKRLWRRISIVISLSVLVGLTALPAAQPATPAVQECRGTLVLESFFIVSDTDPNPPWTRIDQWTYHVYVYQNGVRAKYQDYLVLGDTGYLEEVNLTLQQSIPLGAPGDPVKLKLELWTKEVDRSKRASGVPPSDRGRTATTRTESCAPGEFRFSVFNDVPANPTPPGPDEHDGRFEFRWKWTLEVV
jgi:hypothetical protein